MTQEHPPEDVGKIRCSRCNATLDVINADGNTLTLRCNCGTELSVTLLRDVPAGWSG